MLTMKRNLVPTEAHRSELGDFLRSRRERLSPETVGLPNGFRRRTPGLRREEVALLAGVGATWYTWLEQGRSVRASVEVLSALADALRLDAVERHHLFILSDRPPPQTILADSECVEASLQRMLDSLTGQPAYLIGRRWDILVWNQAAIAVFGDYAALQGDERNIMHLVFANARHRRLLVDWNEVAPVYLAMFRADSARYAGHPDLQRLIATLMRTSPEFKAWWPKHDVVAELSNIKRIRHPRKGIMLFEFTSFAVTDGSGRKLIVYTPQHENKTADKLEDLLRLYREDRFPDGK